VKLRELKDCSIKNWVLCVYNISFSTVWVLLIRNRFNVMGFNTFTVYDTTVLPLAVIYISRQRKAFCQLPTAAAFVVAIRKHCNKNRIVCCCYWKTWNISKVKTLQFLNQPHCCYELYMSINLLAWIGRLVCIPSTSESHKGNGDALALHFWRVSENYTHRLLTVWGEPCPGIPFSWGWMVEI